MNARFDPEFGSICVPVTVVGPRWSHDLQCVIDSGSQQTILPTIFLRALGCDLSKPAGRVRIRSATGTASVPLIRVSAIMALDRVRPDFLVAAHDFPLGTTADGLLGLDFFLGFILNLDFIRGRASLFGRSRWQFWR